MLVLINMLPARYPLIGIHEDHGGRCCAWPVIGFRRTERYGDDVCVCVCVCVCSGVGGGRLERAVEQFGGIV